MAAKIINKLVFRREHFIKHLLWRKFESRTFLSEAYACNESWEQRLHSPLLQNIKMGQYFIEVDKKFQSTRLVSGIDIDLFAINVIDQSQLDELEHLLYKFRKTKRSVEILDSTTYAVIKAYMKFQDFESLFRILRDRVDYGIFPDSMSYNLLMDLFLKQKQYRDATEIAVLMMLQEDLSNPIGRLLSLYSCQMYLNEEPRESWEKYLPQIQVEEEKPVKEGDEEEEEDEDDDLDEKLVRVPFLREPWFDDHFDIKDPQCLIGKTLYLNGREEKNILGRTYQLVGLAMQGKWEKAQSVLQSLTESESPVFFEEGISKFKEILSEVSDEEIKAKWSEEFHKYFRKLEEDKKLTSGMLEYIEKALQSLSQFEDADIKQQEENFLNWEKQRQLAMDTQSKDIDKENRLKVIKQMKEDLYWKEKLLFFYENEEKIKDEEVEVDKIIEKHRALTAAADVYEPPQMEKKKATKISKYKKLAMVKAL